MGNQTFGFMTLEELKRAIILDRLATFENNQDQAAKSLRIHRHSIAAHLKRYAQDDVKSKARIELGQKAIKTMTDNLRGYEHDPESGLSKPVAAQGVLTDGSPMLMPRPAEGEPVAEAANKANDTIKTEMKFLNQPTKITTTPAPKNVVTPMSAEVKKEKEHFKKLDKTPISKTLGLANRGNGHEPAKAKKKTTKKKKSLASR